MRMLVAIPRRMKLATVDSGKTAEYLVHCADRETGVIGARALSATTGGHLLAGPEGTAHGLQFEYAPEDLGVISTLALPCEIGG